MTNRTPSFLQGSHRISNGYYSEFRTISYCFLVKIIGIPPSLCSTEYMSYGKNCPGCLYLELTQEIIILSKLSLSQKEKISRFLSFVFSKLHTHHTHTHRSVGTCAVRIRVINCTHTEAWARVQCVYVL